jgi:hypothetical protein
MLERVKCLGSPLLAAWTAAVNKLRIFQQPGLLRIEHRTAGTSGRTQKEVPIVRLQGGFHANPVTALAEDMSRNARDLFTYVFSRERDEEAFSATAVTRSTVRSGKTTSM